MARRPFFLSLLLGPLFLGGCALWRIDVYSPYVRSDLVDSPEKEKAVLAKASVGRTEDGRITVVRVAGTHYEMGYQQGALLRDEIRDNIGYLYDEAVKKFRSPELFDEAYERMRPFIPQAYVDEMHGLAHGSKLPLRTVHAIHALPEIGEWGGKKRLKETLKKLMAGEWGTSCSNLAASGSATVDGSQYVVRILDWGLHRISKLHKYPVVVVGRPDGGVPFANVTWAGFLGAISGMNAEGITLGEMGYGDVPNETLAGFPMPFLLRDVLLKSRDLNDVTRILRDAAPTNSFVFLMADGKNASARMFVKDPNRFLSFGPGEEVRDARRDVPAVTDVVYGGHDVPEMNRRLTEGPVSPEKLMSEVIPAVAMKSNFQNVVYHPSTLRMWIANAKDVSSRAAESPYTMFDLKAELAR